MADPGPFKPDFAVTVAVAGGGRWAVIGASGELDSSSAEELLVAVERAIAARPSGLTLDLGQVTFVDSGGMRILIMIERLAAERGVDLTVTPAPEHVTELLRTAGVVGRTDAGGAASGAAPPATFLERTELELPRDAHSPARARAEVRECVSGAAGLSELANLVLLTSELVTNAVVHPRGVGDSPIGLRVIIYRDRVRVEVEDSGDGFEHARPESPEGERGRGLFLVDRFSDRWGSGRVQTEAGPRFRVWFEMVAGEQGTQAVA